MAVTAPAPVWIPDWWFNQPTPGTSDPAVNGEPSPITVSIVRAVADARPPAQGGDPWPQP